MSQILMLTALVSHVVEACDEGLRLAVVILNLLFPLP
jgi:hypothetical protein